MNRITINTSDAHTKISRHIYGHFSEHLGRCIYGGLWVGHDKDLAAKVPNTRGVRNDVLAALKKIKIPNLRWPGGCFADEYHWRDGIGTERPKMVNTHWGGVTEDNSFGTHEFLDLCALLSEGAENRCEPYICGNVGSGTVQELSQWVEYCNFDGESPMTALRQKNGRKNPWGVRFWGIGNENWGCGGNMSPEFYADNYKRYATYARAYGAPLYKIACGSHDDYYEWTRVLMEKAGKLLNGLSLHYYTVPGGDWTHKGQATEFNEAQWFTTMKKAARIDELVRAHGAIMDESDPERLVGMVVDEWGSWFDVEPGTNPGFLYQQNTLRDALIAGLSLNIFNNYAERISMANIAQTVNVLQAVILTDGEKMLTTPTYHVYDMYKVHHDAVKLPAYLDGESAGGLPALGASASIDSAGKIHVSLTNIDPKNEQSLRLDLRGGTFSASAKVAGQLLTSPDMHDHNTFDEPAKVAVKPFPSAAIKTGSVPGCIELTMPPMSVAALEIS